MKASINIILIAALLMVSACARTGAHIAKGGSSSVVAKSCPEQAQACRGVTLPEQSNAQVPEQRVYFPFASDSILQEASSAIAQNIEWLSKNNGTYVILEGHCDEVGQSEFNMQLGDRRARAVKAYMIEQGVSPERIITVVSYGSLRPLNPGHTIEDLRDNRRVEFVIR